MTVIQYSTIQRCLGQLEGVGASLDDRVANYYFDCLETLNEVIEEIKKEEARDE